MKTRSSIRSRVVPVLICLLIALADLQAQENSKTSRLLPVKVNGKWGYINDRGRIAIKPRFIVAGVFSEGLAKVRNDDSWFYYIDRHGRRISNNSYFRYADDFSEGLAMVQGESSDDKIGFIDKTGKVVISPRFDGYSGKILWSFTDGLAIVAINDKFGYIDKRGTFVIDPQFQSAAPFSEGLAVVSKNGKYGFIDREGNTQIDYRFATAFGFSEGVASFSIDRQKFGLIDKAIKKGK
ncbi:MAG: WG repeat-containing protein [Acidobacteriota bacterium]